jgi:hypothetical protein
VGGAEGQGTVQGRLFANENMGPESLVTIERPGGQRLTARVFTDEPIGLAETVKLSFVPRHVHLFGADGYRLPGRDG